MKIHMSGNVASLEGAWTLAGVTQCAIDSLAVALQQIIPGSTRMLHIDCRDISVIDANGLHLLYGWVQCARLRGVEPELILSRNELQQTFQNLKIPYRYTSLIMAGDTGSAKTTEKGDSCMKNDEIKEIAKRHNIKVGKAKKSDLVRAIQQAEGNLPCFDSNSSDQCGQDACLWRGDCA
jgi:ABC-type transporter Mla MlaB component